MKVSGQRPQRHKVVNLPSAVQVILNWPGCDNTLRLATVRTPGHVHHHVRARAVASADERPRAARAVAGEEVDVRAAKAAAIAGDEHAVVRRAVGELRPFQLRDVDPRSELDEAWVDGDGPIRNERAAGAADAELRSGDAAAALARDPSHEIHRASLAQHDRAL